MPRFLNARTLVVALVGISISALLPLSSTAANPAVIPQTQPADPIATDEATLHATIGLNGKAAYVAFQVRQAGRKRYIGRTAWQKIARGQTNVSFSATVSGLAPDTDYEFHAIALVGVVRRVGNQLTFHSAPQPPVATTGLANDIAASSAALTGTVSANASVEAGVCFEWGTTTNYGNSICGTVAAGSVDEPVQAAISNLLAGTTYHYRVVATNSGVSNSLGVVYGQDMEFTTLVDFPHAATLTPEEVDSTSVRLRGVASATGAFYAYFQWDNGPGYGQGTPSTPYGAGTNNISYSLGNLRPNHHHHFRLVVLSSVGTSYGEDVAFITLLSVPTVATLQPSPIVATTTTLKGQIDTYGAPASVHFEWGSTTNYGNATEAESVTIGGSGYVTAQLTGLASNTVYHYRIVASNSVGMVFGNDFTFGSLFDVGALRSAIAAGGTIMFPDDGRIPAAPEMQITNAVTLDANGHRVVLDVAGRLFNVHPGGELRLIGLTLQNGGLQTSGDSLGGAILLDNATLIASNCSFIGNRTVGVDGLSGYPGGNAKGGAIAAIDSFISLRNCSFRQNSALGGRGGYVYSRPISYFAPNGKGLGGAIWTRGGILAITDTIFGSNTLSPQASGFGSSASFAGGAIYAETGHVEITSSVFTLNAAGVNGGAIYNSGLLRITNSTFAGNASGIYGTALFNDAGGNTSISYCTVASNSLPVPPVTPTGAAIHNQSGTMDLLGTILSGNALGNLSGTIIDIGYNISSDASANFTAVGSLNNTDPLLGPLSNSGGFTLTFPLLPGSPAIDAANPLNAPATDQRGVARPQGPAPDIGAFERQ